MIGALLLPLCFFNFISCSSDEEDEPSNTVTLNMMNEDNGKTRLGASDVFINKSFNFKTTSCYVLDAGNASGLGVKTEPNLDNLAQEVAVSVGHLYHIYDEATLLTFPSGKLAVQIEAAYYKTYVASTIIDESNTTGAVIKYVLDYPNPRGLPELGELIGTLNQIGESIEYDIPKDAECYFVEHNGSGEYDSFDVQVESKKLKITLLKAVDDYYGPYGTYNIYIRSGEVFTVVDLHVGF